MEEKLNKEAKKGCLRLAGGAPRITVGCTGSEDGKHTSGREEGSSSDLGAVVDRGGGVYSWE